MKFSIGNKMSYSQHEHGKKQSTSVSSVSALYPLLGIRFLPQVILLPYYTGVKTEDKRSEVNLARLEKALNNQATLALAVSLFTSSPTDHSMPLCSAFSLPMESNKCFWTFSIFQSDTSYIWNILLTPLFLCQFPVIPQALFKCFLKKKKSFLTLLISV